MPLKNGQLTRFEDKVVKELAQHGSPTAAAVRIRAPIRSVEAASRRPGIKEAIIQEQSLILARDALPLAVKTLLNVMNSDTAANKDKLRAADITLKYVNAKSESAGDKQPHEMSPEELAAEIDRYGAMQHALETIAAGRATPVEDVPPKTQEGDIFG